jgi:hypothetical protein
MNFEVLIFFQHLSRKFKFHYNVTRITGILRAHRYALMTISRSILLKMRKVSGERCRQNKNTDIS